MSTEYAIEFLTSKIGFDGQLVFVNRKSQQSILMSCVQRTGPEAVLSGELPLVEGWDAAVLLTKENLPPVFLKDLLPIVKQKGLRFYQPRPVASANLVRLI